MIEQINKKELPRERLIEKGPDALKDSELLAIMLGFGNKENNVLELSNYLINNYGLSKLLNMSYNELSQIKGIKQGKATRLMACFEIAKRACIVNNDRVSFKTSKDIYNYIFQYYKFEDKELSMAIFVDHKLKLLGVLKGENFSNFMTNISVKQIVEKAISYSAYGIILVHNHPSGDITPSNQDILTTKQINEVLYTLELELIDHLIISNEKYFSFLDNGLLM